MGDERGERSEQHTPGELKHLGRGGSGAHRGWGAEAPKGDGDGLPNAGLAWPKTEDPAAGALVAPKDEAAGCPNADEPNPVLPAAAPKAEEPPKADPVEAPKRPADAGCCCCGCWGCPKTEVEPKGGRLGRLPEALRWGGGRGSVAQRGASGRRGTRDGPVRTCG